MSDRVYLAPADDPSRRTLVAEVEHADGWGLNPGLQAAGGKVAYFNFELARQMQLLPANHADRVTSALEKVILDAFAIQIINEYDLAKGEAIPEKLSKPGKYMATRYLQAQHRDKRGLHSGDGRAI